MSKLLKHLKSIPQNIERVSLEVKRASNEKHIYYHHGKSFIRKLIRVLPRGKLRRKRIRGYLKENITYQNFIHGEW